MRFSVQGRSTDRIEIWKMNASEHYFPAVLFIMQYKVIF